MFDIVKGIYSDEFIKVFIIYFLRIDLQNSYEALALWLKGLFLDISKLNLTLHQI